MSTVRQPYHSDNKFTALQFHVEISGSALAVVETFKSSLVSQNLILKHLERYQYPTGKYPSEPVKLPRQEDMYYKYRHPYFYNTMQTMVDVSEAYHAPIKQHKLQLVLELDLFLP